MKLGIILLAAILMTIAIAATAQENLSAANMSESNSSALKDIILSSTVNPETYIFTLDANQMMEIAYTSGINKNESQNISTRTLGVGALNLTARAMKMTMTLLLVPEGQEESTNTLATEMYLLNDTMYMKVDHNWTKIILMGPTLGTLWKQENEIERQREVLNNSTITLLGFENVTGINCYKIKVIPNLKAYSAIAESYTSGIQASQASPLATSSHLNLSVLFNNSNVSEIMWIAEDTHLPVMTDISMNTTLSSEQLGIPQIKGENLVTKIYTSEVIKFSGFNRSIHITLPEDAKNATAFPPSIGTLGNSSLTNSTNINATKMGQKE